MKFDPPLFVLLFVDRPQRSAAFYRDVLNVEPIERSATFAMFPLPGGSMLGLWSRHTAEPAPSGVPGASEIGLAARDVDGLHAEWVARGVSMASAPTDLDFGRTFVALDPDGHRIRVFRPEER